MREPMCVTPRGPRQTHGREWGPPLGPPRVGAAVSQPKGRTARSVREHRVMDPEAGIGARLAD